TGIDPRRPHSRRVRVDGRAARGSRSLRGHRARAPPASGAVLTSAARAEYERRLTSWGEHTARLDRHHLLISNARLATSVALAVLLWLAFGRAAISPLWAVLAALVFGVLAVRHGRVLNRLERGRRAERLYERALERLAGRWAGTGRDGRRFLEGHAYARD